MVGYGIDSVALILHPDAVVKGGLPKTPTGMSTLSSMAQVVQFSRTSQQRSVSAWHPFTGQLTGRASRDAVFRSTSSQNGRATRWTIRP